MISDTYHNRILKETRSGGGGYAESTVASVGPYCYGLALDTAGDLYIVDSYNGRVLKETPVGSGYAQSTAISGLNQPDGVAVDAAGNLYIGDTYNDRLLMETPSVGGYTQSVLVSGPVGDYGPSFVALDGSGNIYYSTYTPTYSVIKLDVSDPPTLIFPTPTQAGTADTTDGPLTVTVSNNGNASLTFPIPATGTNPGISTSFTLGNSSTCPQVSTSSPTPGTLTAGASCTELISFAPTVAGTISGSLVLTDNNLNVPNATQTISLSGTSMAAAPTAAVSSVAVPAGSTAGVTVMATESGPAGAVTGGRVTFSLVSPATGGFSPTTCTLNSSGSCTTTYIPTGTLAVGTYSNDIQASFAANNAYSAATGTSTLSIAAIAPTVTVSGRGAVRLDRRRDRYCD